MMKRKFLMLVASVCMLVGMTACGVGVSYENLDLNEYLKVGKYKGLEVEGFTVEITDEEIQSQIDSELEAASTSQELEKGSAIEDGDTVNIDYVGKKDGKKFDGGSAEGYDLVIGSDSFIEGFEDGLIGKKVGEKVNLDLTFPEDYSEASLAGQDVVFTVTINSATRVTTPEYDLSFVKSTSEYDSIEAYEAAIEKMLYENKEAEEIGKQQDELWSQALTNTDVKKYPDKIVNYYIEFNSDQIDKTAKEYGVSREEMLASYEFGDEEEFAVVNEDSSKLRVKQEMLIEYIAANEGIKYTDKEAQALITDFQSMGYDEKMIEEQTGRTMDEYVRMELLYQKVLEFLVDNAVIK